MFIIFNRHISCEPTVTLTLSNKLKRINSKEHQMGTYQFFLNIGNDIFVFLLSYFQPILVVTFNIEN